MALVPLLALADVKEDRRLRVFMQFARLRHVDLLDLLSGLLEKIAV
jgi:hypothetical protein